MNAISVAAGFSLGIGLERLDPGGPISWWLWILQGFAFIAIEAYLDRAKDKRRGP